MHSHAPLVAAHKPERRSGMTLTLRWFTAVVTPARHQSDGFGGVPRELKSSEALPYWPAARLSRDPWFSATTLWAYSVATMSTVSEGYRGQS